jgi:thiamine-monophosphate kinase
VSHDTVGTYSETELIARIASIVGRADSSGVIVGIGDDTAVVSGSGNNHLLYTCDMQVEGIHFDRAIITPYQLGRKALAVNLSDIASMGAEPQYALVSIAMPSAYLLADLEELFHGMKSMGDAFNTAIIGGNLSNTKNALVIDVFLTGQANGPVFTRSGARVHDDIYVTGSLGGSAAGCQLLGALGNTAREQYPGLIAKHLEPMPRFAISRQLREAHVVTAMTDISDGLSTDLSHMCDASNVGAKLQAGSIPMHSELSSFTRETGVDPLTIALNSGEEFELLFTATSGSEAVIAAIADRSGTAITNIGRIGPKESGMALVEGEVSYPISPRGWSHFGSGNR